jgi:hypothetical protein
VSDIDTAVVDSLKVLDLKWPIREADIDKLLGLATPARRAFAHPGFITRKHDATSLAISSFSALAWLKPWQERGQLRKCRKGYDHHQ